MSQCRAEQITFRGWEAYALSNDYLRLVAVPAIGGRVMALDLGDYPFLFVDSELAGKLFTPEEHWGDGSLAAWKNYGGDKTWPAPQGWDDDTQWHGPPDPVLDSGIYSVAEFTCDESCAVLAMTSPTDPRTGLRIHRKFVIDSESTRVKVTLSFENMTERQLRWSIWDVTQLRAERRTAEGRLTYDPGCIITAPINPQSIFPKGYNVMFGAEDNPQWQVDKELGLIHIPYLWQIGKIGIDSPGNWIAFCNTAEAYAFCVLYQVYSQAEYPDQGARVEVWTVGAGQVGNLNYEGKDIYLMETEVLSPLMTIPPYEIVSMELTWCICRCNGPVISVNEISAANQPLTCTRIDDQHVRLQFSGGVFREGVLLAQWMDQEGHYISEHVLEQVSPLHMLNLDQTLNVPSNARHLVIQLEHGVLGSCAV